MNQSLFKRILYATDMSDNAVVAAHYAMRLAHDNKAHLTIVNVATDMVEEMSMNMRYDLASHCDKGFLDTINQDAIDKNRKALLDRIHTVYTEIKNTIPDCEVEPEVSIRVGNAAEQIVLETETDYSDLIVVGARGHSLLDEILVGSVARGVVKRSHVPVMTIPLANM